MLSFIFTLLLLALATEAAVELVIKSSIFESIRKHISKLGSWPEELLKCGYCFSVWIAAGIILVVPSTIINVSPWLAVNFLITVLIVHRLSNITHNVIDKWTDKYYDLRYTNTVKD